MCNQTLARRWYLLNSTKLGSDETRLDTAGLAAAIGAYTIWGVMPLFFKQIDHVPAPEIIAHRVIWAVPLLLVIMTFRSQLLEYWQVIKSWKMLRWMLVSAFFISINWLLYVWAVNNGQILAASLAYYLNPLLNVALGTILLGERLTRRQWWSVGLAGLAVIILALGALSTLWISMIMALSFCIYGFVRKLAPVAAVPGLAVETTVLLPISMLVAFYFSFEVSNSGWISDSRTMYYLIAGGAVTAIPLMLFAVAARRMSYSLLGFIQYIGPTLQFIVGVFVYREVLDTTRLLAFALIWAGLILFSSEVLRQQKS